LIYIPEGTTKCSAITVNDLTSSSVQNNLDTEKDKQWNHNRHL